MAIVNKLTGNVKRHMSQAHQAVTINQTNRRKQKIEAINNETINKPSVRLTDMSTNNTNYSTNQNRWPFWA